MTKSDPPRAASTTPDTRVATGRITADPNPLPAEVETLTISWETNAEQAEVHVSEDGEPEKLLAQAATDSVVLDWIKPGVRYAFRLYESSQPRALIDEVTVSLPVKGRLMIDPLPNASAFAGTVTIHWQTTAPAGEIVLHEPGDVSKVVSRGPNGSFSVDGIKAGVNYLFQLYAAMPERPLLAEANFFHPISGKISAAPNPIPLGAGSRTNALVEWQITEPAAGEILLREKDVSDKVVCRGPSGLSIVQGLNAGVEYLFQLYAAIPERPLLAEANFFYPISGKISAAPNPIPLGAGSRTTLHWEITPPAIAEIRLCGGHDEKTVCCGQSGSFEVSGLRAGEDYLFRIYDQENPLALLDETKVRVEQIVWAELLELFQNAGGAPPYSDELAKFVGAVLSGAIHQTNFPSWFRQWENAGFHVTPVHFYEPIPDSRTLSPTLWTEPLAMTGVDMNDDQQRHLLTEVFPAFRDEYLRIPLDAPAEGHAFYLRNGRFEGLDPLLAYCMVRHYRPRRIIEVGSGHSTLLMAQAALENGDTELHSIEPYPEEILTRGVAGLTSLLDRKVEEVDRAFFQSLHSGDILFIDTSHVVRIGGDVNYLFLEILPLLQPGVIVHVHDIFFPYEYPENWVMDRRRFWTEQYLLQAFLAYNSEFEVLVGSGYLKAHYPEQLKELFPRAAPWQGGSFWMRRRPA